MAAYTIDGDTITSSGNVSGSPSYAAVVKDTISSSAAVTGSVPWGAFIDLVEAIAGTSFSATFPVTAVITQTITVTATLNPMSGGRRFITATVTASSAVTGRPRAAARIDRNTVTVGAVVLATLRREKADASSKESFYERTGVRSSLPTLVYDLAVRDTAGALALGDGQSFLVSPSFVGVPGDPFYDQGAAPNFIGTKIKPTVGPAYLVFRQPVDDEVVWYQPGEMTYRWRRDPDTGVSTWVMYRTLPQRSLDGQFVFSLTDPDRVFSYYSKLLGAVMSEWSYDNRVLLDQIDPDKVSRFYLPALAAQWGLSLRFDDDLAVKRAKVKSAVGVFKFKGLDVAAQLRLRALGYTGFVREIWINPTAGGNFQSAVLNKAMEPSSTALGAGTDFVERPHGYGAQDPSDGYFLSSRVSVHLNDEAGDPIVITDDIKQQIARELRIDILPVHVDIRYFVTDINVLGHGGAEKVGVADSLSVTHV